MNKEIGHVFELVNARWKGRVMHAGVKLGIFEEVSSKTDPISSAAVASKLKTDPDMTYRLMRALGSIGFLKEGPEKTFTLTHQGEVLRADFPHSPLEYVLALESAEDYVSWKYLADVVQDGGKNGFEREFNQGYFDYCQKNQEFSLHFDKTMTLLSMRTVPLLLDQVATLDLSSLKTACDIGGGQGYLISTFVKRFPQFQGMVLEREPIVADTANHWSTKLGVQDQVKYIDGDMFKDVPEADLYLLKHIIHDWPDEQCVKILKVARSKISKNPAARLLIFDFVIPGPDQPSLAKLMDINMLVLANGKERTKEEFAVILERSGWKLTQVKISEHDGAGVIEAVLSQT